MNDIYANYPNNIGTIGVYWTCLNCDKSFKKRPVITKTVDARKDAATVFSNPDSIAHTPTRFTPMVHGQMVAGAGRHGSALKELISLVISV